MWRNLHKHAPLLPPPLFMINEIRVAFAHRFKDVIADNCSFLPKLEAALFDVCSTKGLLKVLELSGCRECTCEDEDIDDPPSGAERDITERKARKMKGEENHHGAAGK